MAAKKPALKTKSAIFGASDQPQNYDATEAVSPANVEDCVPIIGKNIAAPTAKTSIPSTIIQTDLKRLIVHPLLVLN